MAWMTAMRDRIHLEKRINEAYGRKLARLNRLDNATRAMHLGYTVVWTRRQRNERRRLRQTRRLTFREISPRMRDRPAVIKAVFVRVARSR
jgi:hypothetical protein